MLSFIIVIHIVLKWKEENGLRKVFTAQQPDGKRAEFDWGYVELIINKEKVSCSIHGIEQITYRYSKIFERESPLEVIKAHIDFFSQIVGVPQHQCRIFVSRNVSNLTK